MNYGEKWQPAEGLNATLTPSGHMLGSAFVRLDNGSRSILFSGDIRWAEHIVLFFPLWLGDMPALLKGFLEQVARPGFAFEREAGGAAFTRKGLKGRSARVVVTMGMPALVYRWYFRAHSVKSLERNILGFVGIAPVHETLIGMVGDANEEGGRRWLAKLRQLGARAQ